VPSRYLATGDGNVIVEETRQSPKPIQDHKRKKMEIWWQIKYMGKKIVGSEPWCLQVTKMIRRWLLMKKSVEKETWLSCHQQRFLMPKEC
jgi:hypothetical protein